MLFNARISVFGLLREEQRAVSSGRTQAWCVLGYSHSPGAARDRTQAGKNKQHIEGASKPGSTRPRKQANTMLGNAH